MNKSINCLINIRNLKLIYLGPKLNTNNRQEQGQMIASIKNAVKRINDVTYIVNSQSGSGSYTINLNKIGFVCSCPDHQYRDVKCKHIHAVEFSSPLREQVQSDIIITPIDSLSCRYCNSENILKKAIRHNKYNNIEILV